MRYALCRRCDSPRESADIYAERDVHSMPQYPVLFHIMCIKHIVLGKILLREHQFFLLHASCKSNMHVLFHVILGWIRLEKHIHEMIILFFANVLYLHPPIFTSASLF